MFTVNEFLNGKWIGYWATKTATEAQEIVSSLKVSRKTKSYNIESPEGTVLEVFKAHNAAN